MNKTGWIEVICGPMFAGKSEEIIRRCKRMNYAKKKYIVFKPLIDNRYADDKVVSHDQRWVNSINISNSSEVMQYISEEISAVVFDEVQFLDEGIVDICEQLSDSGLRVICAGLDMDFRGIPFPIMANLLARAEKVDKLTAICVICGQPATRTQRIVNGQPASVNDDVILVAGKESYEARCRHCHEVKK